MSETSEKVIDKIIDNATSRLKIPIVSTYIIVLLVHNWDLVYYLLFQTGQATTKIAYIKTNYPNYWGGIFKAVGIAICVLVAVSLLDLGLSWVLQKVYTRKKKITDKINSYKTFEALENEIETLKKVEETNTHALNNLTEKYKFRKSEYDTLETSFNNLKSKNNIDAKYTNFGRFTELLIQHQVNNQQLLRSLLKKLTDKIVGDDKSILFSRITTFNDNDKDFFLDNRVKIMTILNILSRMDYIELNRSGRYQNDPLITRNDSLKELDEIYFVK